MRKMDPRRFGQAPGFEQPFLPEPLPPGVEPPPPYLPPVNPPPGGKPPVQKPVPPIYAKQGQYLNNGIAQLPMSGQGDTLTTQAFQAGFRPRR